MKHVVLNCSLQQSKQASEKLILFLYTSIGTNITISQGVLTLLGIFPSFLTCVMDPKHMEQ